MFWPSAKPVSLRPLRNAVTKPVEASADPPLINPISGTRCCARTASGHAAAAPLRMEMNSRRRMSCLGRGQQSSTSLADKGAPCAPQRNTPAYVGSGSDFVFTRPGSKPESALLRLMSAFTGSGHGLALALVRVVPILLQKSFSTADQNFSSPLMRFADKYVRDLVSL